MKNIIVFFLAFKLVFLSLIFLNGCKPIRNLTNTPVPYNGSVDFKKNMPVYDAAKKTIFIVADCKLTELFDMLAPFTLFNATQKANVYIVAKTNTPILIKRDLYILPQLTFSQADSMQLHADVMVIPALSIRDEHQDTTVINWIRNHFTASTKILTICDGASTGAATGLYDGKLITCHASDYNGIKKCFNNPIWINNTPVTKSGNLFSTAGVSNAVDGSLTVINELFGYEIMQKVLNDIHYPYSEIRSTHQSVPVNGRNKFIAAEKIFFRENKDIGILLADNMNEFEMATLIDTYGRTLPASLRTFILNNKMVQTKYGLTVISTADNVVKGLDELHVLMPESFSKHDEQLFKNATIITYDKNQKEYLIDICLKRIQEQYGRKFKEFVKISLDYN